MSVTKHLHTLQLVSTALASISREIWMMASSRSALPLLAFCVLAAAAFWRQPPKSIWIDRVESSNEARFTTVSKYFRRIFRAFGTSSTHGTCAAQILAKKKKKMETMDIAAGSGSNPDNPGNPNYASRTSFFVEHSQGLHSDRRQTHNRNPNTGDIAEGISSIDENINVNYESQRASSDVGIDCEPHMTQMQFSSVVSTDGEISVHNGNTFAKQSCAAVSLDPVVDIRQPRMYRPAPIGQKASVRHTRWNSFDSDRTMALWPSPHSPEYGLRADSELRPSLSKDKQQCVYRAGFSDAIDCDQRGDGFSLFTSDVFC